MKKNIVLSTILILFIFIIALYVGIDAKKVKASTSNKTSEQKYVLRAYKEFLRTEYNDMGKYFAIADLDVDGIPELLVRGESSLFTENYVYLYQNGEINSIPWDDAPNWNLEVKRILETRTFVFSAGGWKDDDIYIRRYVEYQLNNGEIHLINDTAVEEHHNESIEVSYRDHFILNGEDCTEEKYQEIENRFEQGEEITYFRNAEEGWELAGLNDHDVTSPKNTPSPKLDATTKKVSKLINAMDSFIFYNIEIHFLNTTSNSSTKSRNNYTVKMDSQNMLTAATLSMKYFNNEILEKSDVDPWYAIYKLSPSKLEKRCENLFGKTASVSKLKDTINKNQLWSLFQKSGTPCLYVSLTETDTDLLRQSLSIKKNGNGTYTVKEKMYFGHWLHPEKGTTVMPNYMVTFKVKKNIDSSFDYVIKSMKIKRIGKVWLE